ncbi:hypothetical protein TanjilG_18938 [Lupinus angustifolius]|uniref:Tyrosine specific protein phosphatases domain-containing protein n=1 Tax=Lupinus angustifolius TaxID=3871 RepID=A0A4P1RRE7_LUPAN|nr:hypothetical protein TanjilG_18938 [Lupinus angustifolius]
MRKRERENPCAVCGHYHKYEEGEVCSICGHRLTVGEKTPVQISAFPSVILPEFLYLGSYDNASRSELLKTQGITQQCEKDKARVLVHCMSGKNRSPAIVIAYLMKSRGWRLAQSYQWVKERRPSVELTEGSYQQLRELEHKIFVSNVGGSSVLPGFPPASSISFGFPKIHDSPSLPPFSGAGTTSIFAQPPLDIAPTAFTFGAGQMPNSATGSPFSSNPPNPNGTDIQMDGS